MSGYGQPVGLVEETPGVFYIQPASSNQYVASVNSQGAQRVVASFSPSAGFTTGVLVSGPDNRLYSSLNFADAVFSVGTQGGYQIFTPLSGIEGPSLTQSLPGGSILGVAANLGGGYNLVKTDLKGSVTTIYSFSSQDILPNTAIVASDGNYYGFYYAQGGIYSVYRVTPSGSFSVIHNFPPSTAIGSPGPVPLLQGSDGNLYGAVPNGGTNQTGIIYKLTTGGQYTFLYQFPKGPYYTPTSLIEASDGNLYGTTYGHAAVSLLFRITKNGEYTVLAELNPSLEGQCTCLLTQGSDGLIYGTALSGGSTGGGVVFSVDAGLPEPAPRVPSFEPQSGAAGTRVLLWGSNLLSPSVQFNGVPATNVVSSGPNYVWATVPEGATSGPITLTTPGGTFTTAASFSAQ